ncbi:MAG TPA: orotidine-5'-phosphate decarboxylase [Methyloceanibacter sp.]|jgi:orotidine-5'-phosphate decarboxylase|nr:orotidine-5'-phosphate decarboxylase [Methyloceanibacter sp.]
MEAKDRLIVALDVPSAEEARSLIETLGDSVGVYKVGLELLFAGGFALAEELARKRRPVFIDAKLSDIEATVERATAAIARAGASFLTVHALDAKTLKAAVRGRGDSALKLLGVTVLTNLEPADLIEQGIDHPLPDVVKHRTALAREAGLDGVIASGREAAEIRRDAGSDFLIVTPGVRQADSAAQDQARAVTPEQAIKAGADYLVVGRPITRAADPRKAADAVVAEIAEALSR